MEVDFWNRFWDDCFGIFRGTRQEFNVFVATMNEVDKDIKFIPEINWKENKLNFLDMTIKIEKGFLQTRLFVKENTKNVLLLPSSCHLPSVTRGTVTV